MAERIRCQHCSELMIGDYDPELGFYQLCQSCRHVEWSDADDELNEMAAKLDATEREER